MADAMGFSVEWAELPQQAHSILWWRWLTGVWALIADLANPWRCHFKPVGSNPWVETWVIFIFFSGMGWASV
jgi:hypothetical protein